MRDSHARLFQSLLALTKSSGFLKPSDYSFYASTSAQFESQMPLIQSRLLNLLLKTLNAATSKKASGTNHQFESIHDLLDHYSVISDAVDSLLERADIQLDEVSGRSKKNAPSQMPMMPQSPLNSPKSPKGPVRHASHISRPQLQFQDKIDNSNRPFVRKITYKPHAKQTLDYGLPGSTEISEEMGQHLRSIGITDAASSAFSLPHPYEYEITQITYPSFMFKMTPEILYDTMEKTPFTWIDTEEKLEELAELLNHCQEMAVDTEHHDLRSFQGFTCLIQISTRKEDFIIDALVLRHHMHILNSSFTNPNIVKVFHGAEMDIQWLQRDFGVYVVNLFDTYHASHVLEMEGHGLAFLLKNYCNVDTDKRFQRADWRLRPLSSDMLYYARSDTHYLLYIYDRMRNEILSRSDPNTFNLLNVTLSRSAETSLKLYKKDIYDSENGEGPNGWKNTLRRYSRPMSVHQFAVYRALHAWRDQTAREADESIHYVLPNHMLFNLVDIMPNNAQQALACCSPIPTFVRLYANEIVALIDNARMETLRNEQAKEAELAKLKEAMEAKEKEWARRKKDGPVHVRFDEQEDQKVDTPASPAIPQKRISTPQTLTTVSGKPKAPSKIRVVAETKSRLLGCCLSGNTKPSKWKEAQALREQLIMEAPVAKLMASMGIMEEVSETIDEAHEVVMEDVQPSTHVVQEEQKGPQKVMEEDKVEPTALISETILVNDESIDVVANVRQKKRKSGKKKNANKNKKLKTDESETRAFSPQKEKLIIDSNKTKSSVAAFLDSLQSEEE